MPFAWMWATLYGKISCFHSEAECQKSKTKSMAKIKITPQTLALVSCTVMAVPQHISKWRLRHRNNQRGWPLWCFFIIVLGPGSYWNTCVCNYWSVLKCDYLGAYFDLISSYGSFGGPQNFSAKATDPPDHGISSLLCLPSSSTMGGTTCVDGGN